MPPLSMLLLRVVDRLADAAATTRVLLLPEALSSRLFPLTALPLAVGLSAPLPPPLLLLADLARLLPLLLLLPRPAAVDLVAGAARGDVTPVLPVLLAS